MRVSYLIVLFIIVLSITPSVVSASEHFFDIQSVDTMKISRDRARQDLGQEYIDQIVAQIAKTGATHVAIGTPYDEEFYPVVQKWVLAARKNNLHVWFRGNASGWEEWFDYKKIDRRVHTLIINNFILSNPGFFEDGDVFVSCPECENGGPGDPRTTGDVFGHRAFLIAEYGEVKRRFEDIHKKVIANYYSMNGDVAKLVMDKETTMRLDGVVTIDHYVKDISTFIDDIHEFSMISGGRVVLGEWGAPIPDIHGEMTEAAQAAYIQASLKQIRATGLVEGINYWTNQESSTSLWQNDGTAKLAVNSLTQYFNPPQLTLKVIDKKSKPVTQFTVLNLKKTYRSGNSSTLVIPILQGDHVIIAKPGFSSQIIYPKIASDRVNQLQIQLAPASATILDELFSRIDSLFGLFSFFEKL